MSQPIIKVQNISKRYRLGLKEQQADTLVGQFKNIITAPYRNYKRLRELSKFGTEDESVFWALKDINFEVQQGEVLGIIGKNGAGKSTLLKILSQITEPTAGKIEIHGRVASLLEVGTGFHPELSGRENIYMNGTILGMTRREIDHKLDEIIDFSGVEKFIDTPVKFYSSGMKVRLGFSVAAHLNPEILIIDEVLAVGDYEFQQKCLGKMEDVSKNQGRTVLFVSHNLSSVQNLCNHTIILKNGNVDFIGDTDEAIKSYLSLQETTSNLILGEKSFDCQGSHSIVLREIKVYSDSENKAIPSVSGKEFFIELEIEKMIKNDKGANGRIDIRIDDLFNQRKIWLSSKVDPEFNFQQKNPRFYIEKLPLTPGEYLITVFIHDGINIASWYPSLLKFRVEDGVYLPNNLKIPENQTNIITPFQII